MGQVSRVAQDQAPSRAPALDIAAMTLLRASTPVTLASLLAQAGSNGRLRRAFF
jgi:hypothetical protein